MNPRTDTKSRLVDAPSAQAYHAVLDPAALVEWLPPHGMTGRVLEFDARSGGRYRIELTYPAPGEGKTSAGTDVSSGRFLDLQPDRRIVQTVEFESEDPAYAGEMIMTWSFATRSDGRTEVTVTAENVPPGISKADHDAGLASSLENLDRYLSTRAR